jgi:hypothetical protein
LGTLYQVKKLQASVRQHCFSCWEEDATIGKIYHEKEEKLKDREIITLEFTYNAQEWGLAF